MEQEVQVLPTNNTRLRLIPLEELKK
jgi:hypothetical protein